MSSCVLMDGCSYASWMLSDFWYALWLWANLFLKLNQSLITAFSVCFKHGIYRRKVMLDGEREALRHPCAHTVPEGFAIQCRGGWGAVKGCHVHNITTVAKMRGPGFAISFLKLFVSSFTFAAPFCVWIVILFLYPSKPAFMQLAILNCPLQIWLYSDMMCSYLFLSKCAENIDCPLFFNPKYFT